MRNSDTPPIPIPAALGDERSTLVHTGSHFRECQPPHPPSPDGPHRIVTPFHNIASAIHIHAPPAVHTVRTRKSVNRPPTHENYPPSRLFSLSQTPPPIHFSLYTCRCDSPPDLRACNTFVRPKHPLERPPPAPDACVRNAPTHPPLARRPDSPVTLRP